MWECKPPTAIAILDCKKKDAKSIISYFKSKVDEVDPGKTLTDTVFDGAANVQKAGQIFCAHSPWAIYFHGWEHVLPIGNCIHA